MMDSSLFFPESLVRALGWTLVHALWQGTAIAAALGVALPRFRSAQQRYWAAYGALLSLALVAAATFVWAYEPAQLIETIQPQAIWALPTSASDAILPPAADYWASMTDRLEAYHPMIVAIWLMGFLFFLFRLATGLHYIHRLRSRQTRPVPDGWWERLQMALGYFKPLILLPIGWANQLTPAEVEAVLAHELAHIARRDWLFNLLQTLIEAVFYFHPAVWWMSATIRAERENCCDDTAVALTGNRLAYAKTLARLQELSRPAPIPALALGLGGATPTIHNNTSPLWKKQAHWPCSQPFLHC
jgi:bla regulator protein blaR1